MDKNMMHDSYFDALKDKIPKGDFERISTFARTGMLLHAIGNGFDNYLMSVGLSRGRFLVLIQLYRVKEEGLSIKNLHCYHAVSSASMTGLIDTLEKDNLIKREASKKDRRKVIIKLTEKGNNFMNNFLPIHFSNIGKILTDFPLEKNKKLVGLLTEMLNSLQKNIDKIEEVKIDE